MTAAASVVACASHAADQAVHDAVAVYSAACAVMTLAAVVPASASAWVDPLIVAAAMAVPVAAAAAAAVAASAYPFAVVASGVYVASAVAVAGKIALAAVAVAAAAAASAAVAVESPAVACAVVAALHLRTGGVVVDGVVGTHNLPLTADCCTPNYRSRAAVMS